MSRITVFHKIFFFLAFLVLIGILCLHFFPDNVYRLSLKVSESLSNIYQWEGDDRPTLVYVKPPSHWLGETESMTSLLMAVKKMGWNLVPASKAKNFPKEKLKNAFGLALFNPITLQSNPSFHELFPDIPIVLINNFAKEEQIVKPNLYMNKLINLPGFKKDPRIVGLLTVSFSEYYKEIDNQKIFPNLSFMMNWYLSLAATYYQPKLNKLMYCGARWSNVRSISEKYLSLWRKLDETDYFAVYGGDSWKSYKSFRGYVPADGKSFVREINKNGICLVMHSEIHLQEGIPSGRIFEAAAAAAVIISDKHPFVMREFKDSVLYVDETREDLFEQIDAHMKWIRANPEKAKEKARLSHAIFLQKFTQEQQLAKLYEALQKARKKELIP